jgi:hypothetical protein
LNPSLDPFRNCEPFALIGDASFSGSAQEFIETRILGCLPKNDEIGLGDCHALGLEQQVAEILVA